MNRIEAIREQHPWWKDPSAPFVFPRPPALRRESLAGLAQVVTERLQRAHLGLHDPAGRATILSGLRQVGKTTFAKQLLEDLRAGGFPLKQIAYLDLDEVRSRGDFGIADLLAAWDLYRDSTQPAFAVIDEIHQLREEGGRSWARQLKGLVDLGGVFVLGTGSAALELREGAADAPGRSQLVRVEPLSFREFRIFRAGGADLLQSSAAFSDLERYLAVGGFPALANVASVVEAQGITRGRVQQVLDLEIRRKRETQKLEQLYRILLELSGARTDVSKLALALGVGRETVETWLDQLERAFLIERVWRSASSTLRQIRGQPKVYGTDPGLVAALARVSDPLRDPKVRGQLQEAAVLRHLREIAQRAGMQIHCLQKEDAGRIESECDFILSSSDEAFLVEVASRSGLPRKRDQQRRLLMDVRGAREWRNLRALIVHAGDAVVEGNPPAIPLAVFLEQVLPDPDRDPLEPLRGMAPELDT